MAGIIQVGCALAVLLGVAACGDDEGEAATTTTSTPTTTTTTTARPTADGIAASVEQGRPFVARELLEVLLRNGSDRTLEVRSLRLVDPRFEVVDATERDVLVLAGHGPISMPITYGGARAAASPRGASPPDGVPSRRPLVRVGSAQ